MTAVVFSSAKSQDTASRQILYWSSEGVIIELKDQLNHPSFSWPLSEVSYEIDFGEGVFENDLQLYEQESGKLITFQVDPLRSRGALIQSARLKFLATLRTGESKIFLLRKKQNSTRIQHDYKVNIRQIGNEFILSNSKIRVAVPAVTGKYKAGPVSRFGNMDKWFAHGEFPAALKIESFHVTQLNHGPVQAGVRLKYVFQGGKTYQVNIRLTAEMEFFELEEEMQGFSTADTRLWRLIWDGMNPTHRYTVTRAEKLNPKEKGNYDNISWEPMDGLHPQMPDKHPLFPEDQRNDEHGKLPFRIAPYDNWMSWWRLPVAAFWDEQHLQTAGLFIKDTGKWDDYQYALWGSKPALSIYFSWRNQLLDFNFPLVTGSRSSAITTYSHKKDIALVDHRGSPVIYVEDLRRWYGWIPLDKVKNWLLDYIEPEKGYPRYFKAANLNSNLSIPQLENTISAQLKLIAEGTERAYGPTPVGSRIYYEAVTPAFDVFAGVMTRLQYQKLRAWYLFIGYLYMDEALMPIRNMLAGHPNFLSDIKGVPGMLAFLFPKHPESAIMSSHFEKALELNLRYHIRPTVPSWETIGGRWTENLATYTWAALTPALRTSSLLKQADGKNRMLQEGISSLGNWLLNATTAPYTARGNRRVYPPQGAHANSDQPVLPDALRILAQDLKYYEPLLSEHLLWMTRSNDLPFESNHERSKPWKDILQGEEKDNLGTAPHLKSMKFTGYGSILRSAFGSPDEMYVYLQQLDEGPNYRWGRAAMGGNGAIYYYAAGKRYSHNGPEDAGDGPFGDTERITNFGVKYRGGYRAIGPYRSIGRGELTEPLYDFGFAQFTSVAAAIDVRPIYRSRSILQSSNDYIAIYDDVPDTNVEGRFSWFVGKEDHFPVIYQLHPGAKYTDAPMRASKSNYHKDPDVMPTRGRYYDGKGSFLTIVSHREGLTVNPTSYGGIIRLPGSTDMLFRSGSAMEFRDKLCSFSGTSGIIQVEGTNYSAALFCGKSVGIPGITVSKGRSDSSGISISTTPTGFTGIIQNRQRIHLVFKSHYPGLKFYMDGQSLVSECAIADSFCVSVPAGRHHWQWNTSGAVPVATEICASVVYNRGVLLKWKEVNAAHSYDVEMRKEGSDEWRLVKKGITTSNLMVGNLPNDEKLFFRVTAVGISENAMPSVSYPVYPTAKKPHRPEGLQSRRKSNGTMLSWGVMLGVEVYRLYRRSINCGDTTAYTLIHQGPGNNYADINPGAGVINEYTVTALNGNGESEQSFPCNTDPRSFLNWQPKTKDGFRRDTENHENGFPEYMPQIEALKPILQYPLTNP